MNPIRKGILAIIHWIHGAPTQRAYEQVQKAVWLRARIHAEREFHDVMQGFYTEQALSINPDQDWWGFAAAKQKQFDHQQEWLIEARRMEAASAKVRAATERLNQLREASE